MAEAQLTDQLTRFETMTNVELRAELKQRGCPTSGNKKDLLAKLRVALQKEYEQNIQQSPVVSYDLNRSAINNSVGYPQNEAPVTYTNLPIYGQATAHYPSVYNLTKPQTVYQSPAPMIPIPQQLPISSFARQPEISSMNIPQVNVTPEKKTRAHSKKSSVDSRTTEMTNTTSIQQSINNDEIVLDTSMNDNNVELKPFVSKSNEEKQKDIERVGGDSSSPSNGSSNAKFESIIKEIPLSDEQQHLNQSNSQEQQQITQSVTIDEEQKSAITTSNNDKKNQNEVIDISSNVNLSADLEPATTKQQDTTTEAPEKVVSQQQLKPNRSQTSSSSSLMKGLNRSTSNRINLSSDILKTLIPDISLAPESILTDELEVSMNEHSNGDNHEQSPILETTVDSASLLSDSMTIGELADQKQQRNRTVVIDVNTDSSSLNDDPIGIKKTPVRLSSFESKTLLDGKTNALMTDEPVRVKDVTAAYEPPSQILYIRGLTRPFTLPQLKELLGRYGTLTEGEFWLDKIKSQCFVTYNTLEEAQSAREALDGCRWPSTNPKTLSVRFGRQNEFEFSKTHDLPPDQMSIDSIDRVVQSSTSPVDEIKVNNKKSRSDVREWDIPKLQQEKEETTSGFLIPEEQPGKTNEPPAKALDDYFRKTKAKPSIYWLPLTDEQIIERTQRQEQRNAERDEEQKKRQSNENTRISDSKSHRQSISPKDKRKRSSSPSKRDSKRH